MKIFRRSPPIIEIGDDVRVKAMGRTYNLRLSEVRVDFRDGASASLVDLSHFLEVTRIEGMSTAKEATT